MYETLACFCEKKLSAVELFPQRQAVHTFSPFFARNPLKFTTVNERKITRTRTLTEGR